MARDIEEFLRKAAERRKQQAQAGQAAPQNQRPPQPGFQQPENPLRPAKPSQPQGKSGNKQQPSPPALRNPNRPVTAEVVERKSRAVGEQARRSDGSKSVSDHAKQISDHARHLGADLEQTDERLEQRLHQKFDHAVGNLQQRSGPHDEESAGSLAAELLAMLSNPKSVQQAILLAELLKRPEF